MQFILPDTFFIARSAWADQTGQRRYRVTEFNSNVKEFHINIESQRLNVLAIHAVGMMYEVEAEKRNHHTGLVLKHSELLTNGTRRSRHSKDGNQEEIKET